MFSLFSKRQRPQNSTYDGLIDSGSLAGESIADIMGAASSVGINVTPEKAMGIVTVFACVQWRASMIGHLPFKLHQEQGDSTRVVRDHPVAISLDEPHEEINKVDFLSSLEACHALYNQAFCQVVRNMLGRVMGFVPLHPGRVERRRVNDYGQPDSSGRLVYIIDGIKTLERADILHIKGLSFDGVNPCRFNDYAKECIGLAIALDKDAGFTFSEGVRFPNLLVTDNEVSQTAYDRIKGWLSKGAGSLFGRLKSTLLDSGIKPWEPKRNYQELEFSANRKEQALAICRMLRVPPHKVGILDNAIKANIEAQQIEAVSDVLAPIACLFEAEFSRVLTRAEKAQGFFLRFNLNALLRGTMKDRSEFYKALTGIRAMNPNEVRKLENMNPYEGGDEFFGPMNEESVTQTINRTDDPES